MNTCNDYNRYALFMSVICLFGSFTSLANVITMMTTFQLLEKASINSTYQITKNLLITSFFFTFFFTLLYTGMIL